MTLCGRVRASVPRVSATCRTGGTGLRQQTLDDRAETLGPALEQGVGAAIAEIIAVRAACPASSISSIAARSYCPASAAINDSGKPSRRNSAASGVHALRGLSCRPGQALADGVDDAIGVAVGKGIEEQIAAAQARDSPRRACFRAPGLAARRRSPCAALRATRGSRQRRNDGPGRALADTPAGRQEAGVQLQRGRADGDAQRAFRIEPGSPRRGGAGRAWKPGGGTCTTQSLGSVTTRSLKHAASPSVSSSTNMASMLGACVVAGWPAAASCSGARRRLLSRTASGDRPMLG